jgi:hypothetical protein
MSRKRLAAVWLVVAASSLGSAHARLVRGPCCDLLPGAIAEAPPLNGMRRAGDDVTVVALGVAVYPAELLPGRYGDVRVEAGAEIVLGSGTYAIDSLSLGTGAVVWFAPFDATGDEAVDAVSLRVMGKLDVGSAAEFALLDPDSATTRDVEITVFGGGRLTIPAQAVVRGTLLAPRAKVTFRQGSRLEGAVYAHRVHVDPGVDVRYHPRPEDD